MAFDPVVSRELKSLTDELATRSERPVLATASPAHSSSSPEAENTEKHEWRDQLGELADAVASFLEEAEKDIAAHPARNVIAALLVGILIGRLLGR